MTQRPNREPSAVQREAVGQVQASLHHAHLMASDIDETIAFWVRCFGGKVVADTSLAGVRNVLLEVGRGRLNLYDQPPNHRGVLNHLGVQVADVSATVAALTDAGWQPRPIKADDALTYTMVQGPDGLLLEVFNFDPETTEPSLRPYFDLPPAEADEPITNDQPVHGGGDLSPEALTRLARPGPRTLQPPDRNDHAAVTRWRTEVNQNWLEGDPPPETLGHHEVIVGGIGCLEVDGDSRRGTVVYAHGGGFCLGSPEVAVPITSRIVGPQGPEDRFRLLSVAYGLAPEHPYPAAVDHVVAVVRAVAGQHPGAPVILAGDSAGANIALAASIVAANDAAPPVNLAGLVLLSPQLDLSPPTDEPQNLATQKLDSRSDVDQKASRWLIDAYRGTIDPRDQRVSPLRAELKTLPPLLIQAGTRDNTMPDAIRLARRARSAGIPVTLDLWDGLWHTWHYHTELPEADTALAEVRRFIIQRLSATLAR